MSAASLATSTAVSTEIPTSALFSAGASLIPSPRNPTTWPLLCRAWMICSFWDGERRANTVVLLRQLGDLRRGQPPKARRPVTRCCTSIPTSLQTLRVTRSLSPVRIFTETPASFSALMACGRGLLGGIEEGDVAEEDHVALVRGGESLLVFRELAVGDGKHAVSVRAQRLVVLQDVLLDHVDEGVDVLIHLVAGADLEHVLHGALADQHVVSLVFHDHRHALAGEVERDLVHLAAPGLHLELRVGEDGPVQEVAQARLVVAVHPGVAQHLVAGPPGDVHVLFQDDPVLGQGPRLVRAEHVDGAEVLDGVQPFDDGLLARHGQGALGEVHRDDHREHLRGQPHGHREPEEERVHPVVLGETDDEEHDQHHDDHEPDHQPREPRDSLVEAGLRPLAGELARDGAEVGAGAGVDHHAARRARRARCFPGSTRWRAPARTFRCPRRARRSFPRASTLP